MSKFLIEVPHEAEKVACLRAIKIFLDTGSHYLANADWGCSDGDHRAWLIVDVDNKDEALAILPPLYRPQAKIVRLDRFKIEDVDEMLRQHGGESPASSS